MFFSISFSYGNIYFKQLNKKDGLSQISVQSICQDELGRMWFGTLEGLNCYDGNSMVSFKPTQNDSLNILGNLTTELVADKKGNLFFTSDSKLIRYDLYEEQFTVVKNKARCIYEYDGNVWTTFKDSIFIWNSQNASFEYEYSLPSAHSITSLYVDPDNCFWIGTNSGLYKVDDIKNASPLCMIPNITVISLYRDSKGKMWIATYRRGMYIIENGISQECTFENGYDISNNDIRCFVEDSEGNIWIGTFNGLNKIAVNGNVITYRKDNHAGSLKHSSIFSLYRDMQGTIWIGTYYGGVHYFNPQIDFFKHYAEDARRDDCLSFFFVGRMAEDVRGNVWICTEGGGLNLFDRSTGLFTHYLNANTPKDKSFHNLKCIEYDEKRDRLYVGTHKQGSFSFDIAKNAILPFTDSKKTGHSISGMLLHGDSLFIISEKGLYLRDLTTNEVYRPYPKIEESHTSGISLFVDSRQNLWISQHAQLIKINMNNPNEKSVYNYNDKGLGRFQVLKIVESSSGVLYLGTNGSGLYKYNYDDDRFVRSELVDVNYCYEMLFTPEGYLAITNEQGLLFYHPDRGEVKRLDTSNQLHLSALNEGCGLLRCADGEIFVGGTSGMTSFNSAHLYNHSPDYNLFFSLLTVNDKNVTANSADNILHSSFPFAAKLQLKHNENNIRITVSSNSYVDDVNKRNYEYKLEGFSKDWNTTNDNKIVYTNLNPGKYKLIVREKVHADVSKAHTIELPIIITPPIWATWYAYLFYIIATAILIYVLLKNWQTRIFLQASLEHEKKESIRNEELAQAKLQFFANVSHEFRTPLTLIISQIEILLQSEKTSPYLRTRLQKIYKNTFQFRQFISELLDFRKLDHGKLQLQVGRYEIIQYLRQIYNDFSDQAQLQHVQFEFQSNIESLTCWFDHKQLRKVFSNLLSNAFKYTQENGKVYINIEEREATIVIKVIDTGCGIPEGSLPFVFDHFYQVESSNTALGSGIGLALSKGIVELHHGKIEVASAKEYGSVFTVTLPKDNVFHDDEKIIIDEDTEQMAVESCNSLHSFNEIDEELYSCDDMADKKSILLVEDNEELLHLLTTILSPIYRVIIAMNGKDGLDKAIEHQPDLILSDIMMPVMTGIDMCRRVKNNFDLCHIPVILLTALTSDNKKMEGLQCGADDYIEKPFNNKMLLGHIVNMIRNRSILRKKFANLSSDASLSQEDELKSMTLNIIDVKFIEKLELIVNNYISDADFDVNILARELGVSRSSLYNKLKALSYMTPNDYILNARLKYASGLLKNNPELQITEIAYMSGFNSLRYFRHCFKASFNITPQEYRS